MLERGIDLSVFHFDTFWMRGYHWCDFVWDPQAFPDPRSLLAKLHERGLKVCLWINPYIGQQGEIFAEAAREGYLLRRPDGSIYQSRSEERRVGKECRSRSSSEHGKVEKHERSSKRQ